MKAEEQSNDSGVLDVANGSMDEKQEGRGSMSSEQCPGTVEDSVTPRSVMKKQEDKSSPTSSSDTAVSDLSVDSPSHNFSIVEEGGNHSTGALDKTGFERRSLDPLSPVDFRGLEQHHQSSHNYVLGPSNHHETSTPLRHHGNHGYHHSVIMPNISPTYPQLNSEWYQPTASNAGTEQWSVVSHDGKCFDPLELVPLSLSLSLSLLHFL